MSLPKYDHEPLLAPGRHVMTLAELHTLCVERFPETSNRKSLYLSFEDFFQRLLVAQLPCEIWINGSFLTSKHLPEDIDVLVMLELDVTKHLTQEQRLLVDAANEPCFIKGVDSFVATLCPAGVGDAACEEDGDPSWAELYGREHSRRWLKGFVVMRLGETDVGLRIRC